MCGCAGWSAHLLFAYGKNRFSHDVAHLVLLMCIGDLCLVMSSLPCYNFHYVKNCVKNFHCVKNCFRLHLKWQAANVTIFVYFCDKGDNDNWHQVKYCAYMWTLPDHQGVSLKWALKILLKHTTFYQNFKISLIWIKNFPIYSIHFWKISLIWKENLPDALLKLITSMIVHVLQGPKVRSNLLPLK